MSFYIEIENWDKQGPKTFLVLSFNIASKVVKKAQGFFANDEVGPNPKATYVEFSKESHLYSASGAVIPVSYQEFKQKMIEAQKTNTIPSFYKI